MKTLIKNLFLNEQNIDVQIILNGHSWAKIYEKRKIGFMYSDLMKCQNNKLQTAIDKFEDENNLPAMKFTSESLNRDLESLGLMMVF